MQSTAAGLNLLYLSIFIDFLVCLCDYSAIVCIHVGSVNFSVDLVLCATFIGKQIVFCIASCSLYCIALCCFSWSKIKNDMFLNVIYTSYVGLQSHNFSPCICTAEGQSHLIFYVLKPVACSVSGWLWLGLVDSG